MPANYKLKLITDVVEDILRLVLKTILFGISMEILSICQYIGASPSADEVTVGKLDLV